MSAATWSLMIAAVRKRTKKPPKLHFTAAGQTAAEGTEVEH